MCTHDSLFLGAHRLEGGKSTDAMKLLDDEGAEMNEDNPLLPQTSEQFQEMLKLVLHEPQPYLLHRRMLDAVVQVQSNHYPYFKQSEQLLVCMFSGTPLRGHPSSLYNGRLQINHIMYNKPLTRGHPLYNGQFLLVPMVSALERFHCIPFTALHK